MGHNGNTCALPPELPAHGVARGADGRHPPADPDDARLRRRRPWMSFPSGAGLLVLELDPEQPVTTPDPDNDCMPTTLGRPRTGRPFTWPGATKSGAVVTPSARPAGTDQWRDRVEEYYRARHRTSCCPTTSTTPTTASTKVTGLTNGHTYRITAAFHNAAGWSAWAPTQTVVPGRGAVRPRGYRCTDPQHELDHLHVGPQHAAAARRTATYQVGPALPARRAPGVSWVYTTVPGTDIDVHVAARSPRHTVCEVTVRAHNAVGWSALQPRGTSPPATSTRWARGHGGAEARGSLSTGPAPSSHCPQAGGSTGAAPPVRHRLRRRWCRAGEGRGGGVRRAGGRALPGRGRAGRAGPQLALPAGRDRHRGPRRRLPGRLRGEDPHRPRPSAIRWRRSSRRKAARLRRLALAWVEERGVRPLDIRIDLVAVLRSRAGRGRGQPPAGGGLMLGRTKCVALVGIDGQVIEVEADAASGLPAFTIIGLPDAALGEARDRVRAAINNSGLPFTLRRLTVNLQPAYLPKAGTTFDLAIAVAVLTSSDLLPERRVRERRAPRRARPRRPGAAGARRPAGGAGGRAGRPAAGSSSRTPTRARPRLVDGVEVLRGRLAGRAGRALPRRAGAGAAARRPARPRRAGGPRRPSRRRRRPEPGCTAGSACDRRPTWPTWPVRRRPGARSRSPPPVATTCSWSGRRVPARRCWPPGCRGCCPTSTATWPSRSPPCTRWSDSSRADGGLITRPPFVDPHHTASVAAIVGGGSGLPRPGAISLAHGGVLFLDEAPEWSRATLDALRQPLEDGTLTIHRSKATAEYPARFQLVLAANPCPCGRASGPRPGLHLHADGPAPLPAPALRAAAGPGRPADLGPAGHPRPRSAGSGRGSRRPSWRPGSRRRAAPSCERLAGTPWRGNAEVPGSELTNGVMRLGPETTQRPRPGDGARHADGPRLPSGAAGRLDPGRPGRSGRARPATRSPWPSSSGTRAPVAA